MASSLDFNSFTTWANIDSKTACTRLSSNPSGTITNPGALQICTHIFLVMKDKYERAQFLLNCEQLGLRSWRMYYAFKTVCKCDYNLFIQCVLKSDEVMLEALKDEEERNAKVSRSFNFNE